MKIGIFGGTFNPPHKGHKKLIDSFSGELGFDKVLIIPDKRPVHKICEDLALDSDRLELCRRTFKGKSYEISTIEIDRPSDSYMIYTVNELKELYPNAELFLVIGSDMFLSFHKWYKYREILEQCTLCVASRNDEDTINRLRSYAFSVLKIYMPSNVCNKIIISPVEPLVISSTELRQKITNDENVSDYLTDDALEFIKQRGLYGYRKKQ